MIKTPEPRKVPGAQFDPARVDKVLKVFSRLRHTQGQWAGRPLNPDPWQIVYVIAPVFGWVKPGEDGGWVRIIRKIWVEVPRKNGKTTIAGGIAINQTTADDEPGAQVFAVARGEKQARYCFDPVKAIAQKSPDLKPYVKPLRDRIVHLRSGSYFAVMSRLADLLHGANPHSAIVDEVHLYTSDELIGAIDSGMGSRRQPLIVFITTAGSDDNETPYALRHERIEQLAAGVIKDPATYGVIWAADIKDDPFDEKTWKKANPGYGISPTRSFMMQAATEAQQSPTELNKFLRLHLNVRTSLESKLFDLRAWDQSGGIVVEDKLKGQPCFAALDLSQVHDLTAFGMIFPPWDDREHGIYEAIYRLWVPEDNLEERSRKDGVDYRAWIREGFIRTTPGDGIDYETIEKDILADAARFQIQRIAFDPKFAWQMAGRLEAAGLEMMQFYQGFSSMGPPTADLLSLLKKRRFHHGGHPVLRWMANCAIGETDANELTKPSKRKSTHRIDGISVTVMMLDVAERHLFGGDEDGREDDLVVYDDPVSIGPNY